MMLLTWDDKGVEGVIQPRSRSTPEVNVTGWSKNLEVTADGQGIVSHAGLALRPHVFVPGGLAGQRPWPRLAARAAGGSPRRCRGARRRSAGAARTAAHLGPRAGPAAVPSGPLPPGLLR